MGGLIHRSGAEGSSVRPLETHSLLPTCPGMCVSAVGLTPPCPRVLECLAVFRPGRCGPDTGPHVRAAGTLPRTDWQWTGVTCTRRSRRVGPCRLWAPARPQGWLPGDLHFKHIPR